MGTPNNLNNFHHWLDGKVGVHRLYFLWMTYGSISLGADGGSGGDGLPELPFTTTLPETNIAPENEPLEKEIPIGNPAFLGAMFVLGKVCFKLQLSGSECWMQLSKKWPRHQGVIFDD